MDERGSCRAYRRGNRRSQRYRRGLRDQAGRRRGQLVVADINLDAAEVVAARLGGRAFEVDLAADFDADALARQADILVNCAGLSMSPRFTSSRPISSGCCSR